MLSLWSACQQVKGLFGTRGFFLACRLRRNHRHVERIQAGGRPGYIYDLDTRGFGVTVILLRMESSLLYFFYLLR